MAATRTSLVEQKRLQWAKERESADDMPTFWNDITQEEMSRLTGNYAPLKTSSTVRTTIRTYSNGPRTSMAEMNGKQHPRYASTISLRSLTSDLSSAGGQRNLDYTSASLISLQDQVELERSSHRRSPSLPPIHTRDDVRYQEAEERPRASRQSRSTHRCPERRAAGRDKRLEEREGETTSGYASDNFEPGPAHHHHHHHQQSALLPCHVNCNNPDVVMGEKTWQNPYYDENSLPSSRKLASIKAGEFNRQRWGSVWGQDVSKDPPPPSWLERGLSRLDHTSQVLVINHDSASSPDSSTTGSLGSDTNKTYLRGQNLPIDADILQEREMKRQKALELQTAIKQQLEEREKKRKEEREKKLKEERDEEERIKRERDLEKQRLEEEQRRQREKEAAKQKKSRAMQEVLEAAERQAKEEKRQQQHQRRRRDDNENDGAEADSNVAQDTTPPKPVDKEAKQALNRAATADTQNERTPDAPEALRVPVSQEVAIVLSGRIEDPELLSRSPLKLVNLVVSPTPRSRLGTSSHTRTELTSGGGISLNALLGGFGSPQLILQSTPPAFTQNRLLTPSKYRTPSGRDCGTQTDCEYDINDLSEKMQNETRMKDGKERKEAVNNSRRDVEKGTNTGPLDEPAKNTLGRSMKSLQARTSLESRPRWNANRPGTRYRTQSEKDPHYQRRMRLRRRQIETSDEGSSDFRRSPSPSRRKHGITKAKSRNSARRRAKLENYDADLSMDSLNSLVPLLTDSNGRISIERRDEELLRGQNNDRDIWCGEEIISHLTTLRNGLLIKNREWDLQESPVSPISEYN